MVEIGAPICGNNIKDYEKVINRFPDANRFKTKTEFEEQRAILQKVIEERVLHIAEETHKEMMRRKKHIIKIDDMVELEADLIQKNLDELTKAVEED